MGAWGLFFDENDDAADWLGEFADGPSWELVDRALNPPLLNGGYLEAPDCSQALAAAEVVAAANGKPSARLATEITKWAMDNAAGTDDRRENAQTVLTRIRDQSELQELWEEADEYAEWKASIDETLSRLG
jgi:hypothetical protein